MSISSRVLDQYKKDLPDIIEALLKQALIDSNVEDVDKYSKLYLISSGKPDILRIISQINSSNISYELIDHFNTTGNNAIINIYSTSVMLGNIDKVEYILKTVNDAKPMLTSSISLYGVMFSVTHNDTSLINVKKSLLLAINYTEGKMSLNDIYNINISIPSYPVYDAISYVIFRNVNDETLSNTPTSTLESLLDVLISMNAPNTLIELILKYIPDTSPFNSSQFRDSIIRIRKNPVDYVSLFHEDV